MLKSAHHKNQFQYMQGSLQPIGLVINSEADCKISSIIDNIADSIGMSVIKQDLKLILMLVVEEGRMGDGRRPELELNSDRMHGDRQLWIGGWSNGG